MIRNNRGIIHTAHQHPGDDVMVLPPHLSGDVRHWGHWIFEGEGTRGLTKIAKTTYPPTDIGTQGIPNMNDISRYLMGWGVILTGVQPNGYGSNQPFATGGATTNHNYLSSAGVGTRGQITVPASGWYTMTASGRLTASGGNITACSSLLLRDVSGVLTYSSLGGIAISGVNLSNAPFFITQDTFLTAGHLWMPAVNVTVSAGTASASQIMWTMRPRNLI